jgi:ribonuclease HI
VNGGNDQPRFILIHADESCLGNQNAGPQPGGAGALIEVRGASGIERFDWFASAHATTNNRMALHGAIAILERLQHSEARNDLHYYSDSKYLVDGITSWIHGWKKRGWKRKGGPIENLEMWQRLDRAATTTPVSFHWVKGHAGHLKNEYTDFLAVRAAKTQISSDGLQATEMNTWLDGEGKKFQSTDPDEHFTSCEETLLT